jgi:peptidyl-prolyl cis-trans isomerase C
MRFNQIMRLFCLFSGLLVPVFSGAVAGEEKPAAGNAASVNGVAISNEDVNRQMFALEQHVLSTQGTAIRPEMIPELRNKILDELIDKELLYQESLRKGIEIEEKAVDEKMDALKGRFPNEETFKDEMNQMNLSEVTLRSQIKKDLTVQQLVEKEILVKVLVSDEDSKSFYGSHPEHFQQKEKVRASHILIKSEADTDPVSKDERRKKLEAVKKRIENGEDFASLAKEFSQCPSAEKGGDLGYFERGKMVKPFEDAAFSMKPGEVSDIVVTPFGFHLIKVTDRSEARTISYDESKERIKQHLQRVKFLEAKNVYVGDLKEKSKVEKY